MVLGDTRLLAIFSLIVIVSGCVNSSTSLSSISENPSDYLGEEIVTEGKIGSTVVKLTMYNAIGVRNKSNQAEIKALRSSGEIGNVDGSIKMVGNCKQNQYASKVKVRGEVKSYSQCNCNYKVEMYKNQSEGEAMFYLFEDEEAIMYEEIPGIGSMKYDDIKDNRLLIDSKSDFEVIDNRTKKDLSDKLDLQHHFSKNDLRTTEFDENGEVINKEDNGNTEDSTDQRLHQNKEYTLGSYSFTMESFNETRIKTNERDQTQKALSKTCKKGEKYTKNLRSEYDVSLKNYTINGCQSESETRYYFKCSEVVKQIE